MRTKRIPSLETSKDGNVKEPAPWGAGSELIPVG